MNGSVMNVVCFEWSVMNGLFWTGLFWTDTVIFRYLVNPVQNQTRSTYWHSAINRSISPFKVTFFRL